MVEYHQACMNWTPRMLKANDATAVQRQRAGRTCRRFPYYALECGARSRGGRLGTGNNRIIQAVPNLLVSSLRFHSKERAFARTSPGFYAGVLRRFPAKELRRESEAGAWPLSSVPDEFG